MRIVEKGILNRCEPGTDRATLSFSRVVSLSHGTVLTIFRSGSTKDCDDNTTEFQYSNDEGRSWRADKVRAPGAIMPRSDTIRRTAWGCRQWRLDDSGPNPS